MSNNKCDIEPKASDNLTFKAMSKKWSTSAKLSVSAQRVYKILADRANENRSAFVTLSVKDAAFYAKVKNHHTLARVRKELIDKELVRLAPSVNGQSIVYELTIPSRFQRATLGATLSRTDRGRVRTYTADNVRWVAEMLLGDAQDYSNDDALLYRCPFHVGNEYSLSVTSSKNLWQCLNKDCARNGTAKGYKGGGNLIALVSAYKLRLDRQWQNNARLLHPAKAREVISQIIDSTVANYVDSVDQLVYTQRNDAEGNPICVGFVDDEQIVPEMTRAEREYMEYMGRTDEQEEWHGAWAAVSSKLLTGVNAIAA